jgi:ankyrin repeat protein
MTLHELLDFEYGTDGDIVLQRMLAAGVDINQRSGPQDETPLHVAARRRRAVATNILLSHGADIDARTAGGKTAYAHAIRRKFSDVVAILLAHGADTTLNQADEFAVAVVNGRIADAQGILAANPRIARTGNPEEDRLFADIAGRGDERAVELLIQAGGDLAATGLDSGTPLHQAAWFGQPGNARLLIHAGAPLDMFDATHQGSPLHWAAHGSRHSGDADKRQDAYVAVMRMLLEAGSSLHYHGEPDGGAYLQRLMTDASPRVRMVLEEWKRRPR